MDKLILILIVACFGIQFLWICHETKMINLHNNTLFSILNILARMNDLLSSMNEDYEKLEEGVERLEERETR